MPRVERAGASLYYEIYGDPNDPAVVFAHGAGGNAASWWQQVPFFLDRGFRVVVFDHRGFARSACAEGDLAVTHFPADLLAILDAEKIDRTALVCQSMGGWTGLPTAVQHPERLRCLVLCGTPGGLWTDVVRDSFAKIAERVQGIGGIVGPGGAALADDYPAREPKMAFLYEQIANMNDVSPALLTSMSAAQTQPAELEGFATPTLVISGDKDVLFPPDVLENVVATIPGAQLERFDGAGHSTYFEQPDRFNAVVAAFVDKH
ncbi:MAG: alpha/beta hydrolase [Deltaproteobacteria bacterium]|nr:alpha/beta hydrolase [Deltaproteobacteria bacterium]